ncbi:MAG: response regulator transcription factor [Methylococcales bacterium]|nr:response regulator transcription factor [Methylococcales bacterium]MDP3838851.1 response regulator transcription factor [Methylococcales bacterium]
MTTSKPTVFIVDDDASVLKAVARLLRSAGFKNALFSSAQQFLDEHDSNASGCLVLDVAMPKMNGLALQQTLAAQNSELPIIFLTGNGDIPMSVRAIKQGAVDFLTKPVNDSDLISAIQNAIETNQTTRQARSKLHELQQRLATLTPREREVLSHVVSGKKNKQIALELGTVEKTIKVHRAHLMAKLQVRSLAELVKMSERLGIISSPLE